MKSLKDYCRECHETAVEKGFYDPYSAPQMECPRPTPELLMLVVSELGEACEADRHGDKEHFNEEMADVFIRLFDMCEYLGIDIEKEINSKMIINKGRPRLHGKKY